MRPSTCLRAAAAAILVVAGAAPRPTAAAAPRRPAPAVTVMTQNLYLGADLLPGIQALAADPSSAPAVVAAVWAGVQATDFPTRAQRIAEEIAAARPDVIALQEAILWRSQATSDFLTGTVVPNARKVEYDFVKILLKELRRRRRPYRVAATTIGSDVEAPIAFSETQIGDLRITDRDVLLVRSGVRTTRARSANYTASLVYPILGGVPVERTIVALDVKVRGRRLHVVATHLESDDLAIRTAQAGELVADHLATELPLVVLGDFNTDAALAQPEATYTTLAGALTEVWPLLHPGDPGLTWGQQPRLDNDVSTATQRIDLVFFRGALTPLTIDRVGEDPADRIGGLWPSDHAGVVARIALEASH